MHDFEYGDINIASPKYTDKYEELAFLGGLYIAQVLSAQSFTLRLFYVEKSTYSHLGQILKLM